MAFRTGSEITSRVTHDFSQHRKQRQFQRAEVLHQQRSSALKTSHLQSSAPLCDPYINIALSAAHARPMPRESTAALAAQRDRGNSASKQSLSFPPVAPICDRQTLPVQPPGRRPSDRARSVDQYFINTAFTAFPVQSQAICSAVRRDPSISGGGDGGVRLVPTLASPAARISFPSEPERSQSVPVALSVLSAVPGRLQRSQSLCSQCRGPPSLNRAACGGRPGPSSRSCRLGRHVSDQRAGAICRR